MIDAENWMATVNKLASVKRFSQCELAKPEDVLQHSGGVALVCVHIGSKLKREKFEVDMESLMIKAILHDIEESELGDVSRLVKYASEEMRKVFAILERKVAVEIFENAGAESLFGNWENAKQDDEGVIVSFVDTLCAMEKFRDEICYRGNHSMIPLLSISAFENLFSKLFQLDNLFPKSKTILGYRVLCRRIKNEIIQVIDQPKTGEKT